MEKKISYTNYKKGLSFHINPVTGAVEFSIALHTCNEKENLSKTIKTNDKSKEYILTTPEVIDKHDESIFQLQNSSHLEQPCNTITTEYFTKNILNSFLVISCNENF
jgi:hypothetical protein